MSKNKNEQEQEELNVQNESTTEETVDNSTNKTAEDSEKTDNTETKEEVEDVSVEEQLQIKINELNDRYVRLSAEFDNYRKRTQKEKIETIKNAGEDIFKEMLPIIDDFERGLAHMDTMTDVEALREGVALIYKKFTEFLNKRGVSAVDAKGMNFDVDVMEAIAKMPATEETQKGKVFDCVEKGYKLGDKVIRFAKVVVSE